MQIIGSLVSQAGTQDLAAAAQYLAAYMYLSTRPRSPLEQHLVVGH